MTVAGTGLAEATVAVAIMADGSQVGTGSGAVGDDGTFSVAVIYTEPAAGADLTVSVVLSNDGGDAPAAQVAVFQQVPAPVVTAPAAGAEVGSPVQITGTATAAATIDASISDDTAVIGTANGAADAAGAFDFELTYTDAAGGAALTLSVTQTVNGHASLPAEVALTQEAGVPDAAVVNEPAADTGISSPVTVAGTAEAGATVDVVVLDDANELGTGTGTVEAGGTFSVDVTYTDQDPATDLTIQVTLSNDAGASGPTNVAVFQAVPAPTVTAPEAGDSVSTPLTVEGTGMAGATIDAAVYDGDSEIGAVTEAADAGDGSFAFDLGYLAPAAGTALTLKVTQTVGGRASDAMSVAVTQVAVFSIGGTIDQESGDEAGSVVKVQLFEAADDFVFPLQEQTIAVTEGVGLAETAFGFDVPNGTYYLRAFRDNGGPRGEPDGLPTIETDPQAPSLEVVIADADSTGNALHLNAPTDALHFNGFDVYTNNESFEPHEVHSWDEANGEWRLGKGTCGGYYLRIETWVEGGDTSNLSAPLVRTPAGADLELLNDGGCSQEVADNSSLSYDNGLDDESFSLGIPEPTSAHAGDYYFHYRNTVDDFINVELDNVASIVKLSRLTTLITPTAVDALGTTQPTLEWQAVNGAVGYEINAGWTDGGEWTGFKEWHATTETSFVVPPTDPLADDVSVRININPIDAAPGDEVDARANGVQSALVVDTDGNDSIQIGGAFVNQTGNDVGALIRARGSDAIGDDQDALVYLPHDAATYAITVLKDTTCADGDHAASGRVQAVLDVDGSYEAYSSGNRDSGVELFVDGCFTVSDADIVFSPPVNIIAPTPGSAGVGNTPTFSWENYVTTFNDATGEVMPLGTSWSYILYLVADSNDTDFPNIIWGLPNTTTTFDMSSPPAGTAKYDVIEVATAGEAEPTTNAMDLSGDTAWRWNVIVLDCDYQLYLLGSPAAYPDDGYTTCIGELLGEENGKGFFAQSGEMDLEP